MISSTIITFQTGRRILLALVVFTAIVCNGLLTQVAVRHQSDQLVTKLGDGFSSDTAKVNGTTLHFVRGGSGPAIILLHGFPQDWYAFHKIMPPLAKKFTMIAVDSRGVGGSSSTGDDYDIVNLAEDVYELVQHLKLDRVYVAGHDNGGIVAYTYARLFSKTIRGAMILDSPIPGMDPWDEIKSDPAVWHFGFHQTPNLPEKLIQCHQFDYFREFFNRLALNSKAITDDEVTHYVNSYSSPAQLRAGLEFYRQAYPSSEKFNAMQRGPIAVQIVVAGGDRSLGQLAPRTAESLRKHGCSKLAIEIIKNSGHWVIDEQPNVVSALFERYAVTVASETNVEGGLL
jgi:pimeloyl-ACP methyl ester carboxylesterase